MQLLLTIRTNKSDCRVSNLNKILFAELLLSFLFVWKAARTYEIFPSHPFHNNLLCRNKKNQ